MDIKQWRWLTIFARKGSVFLAFLVFAILFGLDLINGRIATIGLGAYFFLSGIGGLVLFLDRENERFVRVGGLLILLVLGGLGIYAMHNGMTASQFGLLFG